MPTEDSRRDAAHRPSFNDHWQNAYGQTSHSAEQQHAYYDAELGGQSTEERQRHRGRGPKDYRRSDERVREDVCERLMEDEWLDASNIEVTVAECEVTLNGSVNSREEKRRAEDLAEQVFAVKDVVNRLRVVSEGGQSESA
jgi:osmotically-inducible protein OsmY